MGSVRTPGVGETIASDVQPAGSHNEGQSCQNVGTMLWEATKKEWIPASSGNANDNESASEALPVQNLLLNSAGKMDRQRNNENVTWLPSEVRNKTTITAAFTNFNARGGIFWIKVSAEGTGTLKLYVVDFTPGAPGVGMNPGTAMEITGVESKSFVIYPGASSTGSTFHAAISAPLPRSYGIEVVHPDASNWTYIVAGCLIV